MLWTAENGLDDITGLQVNHTFIRCNIGRFFAPYMNFNHFFFFIRFKNSKTAENGKRNILLYRSLVTQNWKRFYLAFISHGIFCSKMLLANTSLEKTEKNGKKRIKVPLQNGKRVTVYINTWKHDTHIRESGRSQGRLNSPEQTTRATRTHKVHRVLRSPAIRRWGSNTYIKTSSRFDMKIRLLFTCSQCVPVSANCAMHVSEEEENNTTRIRVTWQEQKGARRTLWCINCLQT